MAGASKRFRDNLRVLLAENEAKQVELAQRLEKSQAWVSNLITGKRDTPTAMVDAIAEALDVPIERLWLPIRRSRQALSDTETVLQDSLLHTESEGNKDPRNQPNQPPADRGDSHGGADPAVPEGQHLALLAQRFEQHDRVLKQIATQLRTVTTTIFEKGAPRETRKTRSRGTTRHQRNRKTG